MKQVLIILLFIFSFTLAHSRQNIEDTQYLIFLKQTAGNEWNNNVDSILLYHTYKRTSDVVLNKCLQAFVFESKEKYPEAVSLYLELLSDKKTPVAIQAQVHKRLGVLFYLIGSYTEALQQYFASLEIQTDSSELSKLNQNIGALYHKMGQYANAKQYYDVSLHFEVSHKNDIAIAEIYNNIGALYLDSGNLNQSHLFYKKAESIYLQKKDFSKLAPLYNNVGIIYEKSGNADSALYFFLKSLAFNSKYGKQIDVANSKIQIGKYYLLQGSIDSAIICLELAKKIAIDIKSQSALQLATKDLAFAYKFKGNYLLAYENLQLSTKLENELNNKENIKKITRSELQFQYTKEKVKRELEFQKTRIILWFVVAFSILIVILLIINVR